MNEVIAVDPGPTEIAWVRVAPDYSILEAHKQPAEEAVDDISLLLNHDPLYDLAIESIQSYGMPVGASVFETCYWIGELRRIHKDRPWLSGCLALYPRMELVRAVTGVMKVNDGVLRQALLARFGGDKKGEPLHLLKGGGSDKRSAYAVAVYHLDRQALRAGEGSDGHS